MIASLGAALLTSNVFAAGVFHVDSGNPACNDLGPGTAATPYCSIEAAAWAQGGPGTSLLVEPGIYRENVEVPVSGAPGDPFIIKAAAPGAVLDGADDFSDAFLWTQLSGPVWLAGGVTWTPNQVFVDGARLIASLDDPNALAAGSFRYVPGTGLYANVGGGNPGDQETLVGRRLNGFRANGSSYITIDGFIVTRTNDIGIYLAVGCTGNVIKHNTVTFSYSNGIGVNSCTDVLVEDNHISRSNDHGIYVWNSANSATVRRNESSHNVRAGGSGAKGIKIEAVSSAVVAGNHLHHNQDAGLRVDAAIATLSIQNLSWANEGQGFSDRLSTNSRYIGDVAHANVGSGFQIIDGSQGVSLYNTIAVDNGVTIGAYNLQVDSSSVTGFASDFNVIWSSPGSPQPIGYAGVDYSTVADFSSATGNDANTLEQDPLFVDALSGDFHLEPGSPAIDSADSSPAEFPVSDADGNPRVDNPVAPNVGLGPVPYAERGAFEFDELCFGAGGTSCGDIETGECALGTTQCVDGVLSCSGAVGPAAETCNGLDDDCDGLSDNGFAVGVACDGAGECGAGLTECASPSTLRCSTDAGGSGDQSVPETCDTLDNDCDGAADNGYSVGEVCDGAGACGVGLTECAGPSAVQCSTDAGGSGDQSVPETCDTLDNDCDGLSDNGFSLGAACEGEGTCGAGVLECNGTGGTRCSTNPGGSADQSVPETCDGLDDDCDGAADEGFPDTDGDLASNCIDPDDDNDGALDPDDCASLDGTAFGTPVEILDLAIGRTSPTPLAWSAQSLGSGTQYVVAKGDITSPGSTSFPAGVCLGVAVTNNAQDTGPNPALKGIYYYMVKSRNTCGGGTFGSAQRDTHPGCP